MRGSWFVFWMTPATADILKQILIETGRNETAQERHAVNVEGCIMTTYRWVRQKSGEFTLWSSFQFDMTGAELPYNRGAQFVAMPGPTGGTGYGDCLFSNARAF